MEKFINGDSLCIVLARKGERALIAIPDSTLTPYVVPLQYISGQSNWWQGKYFKDLETAYAYFKEVAGS